MFDISKILSRSWHILWKYRILWVFGIFLALAAGGTSPNFPGSYQYGRRDFQPLQPGDWQRWFGTSQQEVLHMLIVTGIVLLVVILVWAVVSAFLRYTAEVTAIQAVKDYEATGVKASFKQLWKTGWNVKAWRLFLINLLLSVPAFVYILILFLLGLWVYFASNGASRGMEVFSIVTSIGLFLILTLAMFLVGIAVSVIGKFAARVAVLEGQGVIDSIKTGYGMIKKNFLNVFLMWLVMIGIGIAWAVAMFLAVIPVMLVVMLLVLPGVLAGALPALAGTGLAALFGAQTPWQWIIGGLVGLPLFFLVTFSPWLLVGGWQQLYNANVWTETYLDLKAMETPKPQPVTPVKPVLPAGRKVVTQPAAKAPAAKRVAAAKAAPRKAATKPAAKTAAKPAAKPVTKPAARKAVPAKKPAAPAKPKTVAKK